MPPPQIMSQIETPEIRDKKLRIYKELLQEKLKNPAEIQDEKLKEMDLQILITPEKPRMKEEEEIKVKIRSNSKERHFIKRICEPCTVKSQYLINNPKIIPQNLGAERKVKQNLALKESKRFYRKIEKGFKDYVIIGNRDLHLCKKQEKNICI